MDHELTVDEKVADEDQEGREDPAVKPHNQHSGQVQSECVELYRRNFVRYPTRHPYTLDTYIMWNIVRKKFEQRDFSRDL